MKFKLWYIIIGLIIVFAVIFFISANVKKNVKEIECPTGSICITTDKVEYLQGENITLNVTNNMDRSIWTAESCSYFTWHLFSKEKDWDISTGDVGCFKQLTPFEIKPKETIQLIESILTSRFIYNNEKYKIGLKYTFQLYQSNYTIAESNEFEIIDKTFLEFSCCHLCKNIPSDKPSCEIILRTNNITNECLDYFQNNPHSVFECQNVKIECESNNECRDIDCYDTPIKHGFQSDCVNNQCRCMCYGCE